MLPSDILLVYLAIAGGAALIMGYRSGFSLLLPLCFRWIIFPVIWRYVPLPLIVIAAPVVIILVGLIWLGKFASLLFGPRASGHLIGTYLVRLCDGIGRAIWLVLTLPLRLLRII